MKIIDKRYDLYDNVCPYSDYPLYVRTYKSFIIEKNEKNDYFSKKENDFLLDIFHKVPASTRISINEIYNMGFYILGYCGEIMLVYYIFDNNTSKIKSFIDVDMFMKEWNKRYSKIHNFVLKPDFHRYFFNWGLSTRNVKEWKTEVNNSSMIKDLFLKIKSPLFAMKYYGGCNINRRFCKFIINPSLIDLNVVRFMNPYNIYRDIERYVGNDLVMCNQKTTEFSDELKRDAHGMDKWSFKKRKQK